jgi:hypothetical protein
MSMDIHDRKARRARAMKLFEAEAREQQLAGVALRQTERSARSGASGSPAAEADRSLPALQPIVTDTQTDILGAHQELRAARARAAGLRTADADLARLHAEIDGVDGAHADLDTATVIDGETAVVDAAPMLPPPPNT